MNHPTLPNRLQRLEEEIAQLHGQDVSWIHDPNIKGAMSSSVADGVPEVRYREFTEGGAAHELLHLRLSGLSYPQIRCYESQPHACGAATMLNNCFQHSLIFPILERCEYAPRLLERDGLESQLTKLRTADFSRLGTEFGFEARLAMLYVRAVTDCASPELAAELKDICPSDTWGQVKQMGSGVVGILRSSPDAGPTEAVVVLNECLDLLGIVRAASVEGHES